jgi:hypothetical protein
VSARCTRDSFEDPCKVNALPKETDDVTRHLKNAFKT